MGDCELSLMEGSGGGQRGGEAGLRGCEEIAAAAMSAMVEASSAGSAGGDDDAADASVWTLRNIVLSIALFIIAGVLEVGGGYLVWLGIREKKLPYVFVPVGSLVLVVYGVVPTFQPASSFGRIFAVYGGFFIVLSYAWAAVFDGFRLDLGDVIGGAMALAGVCVAWFWPR